MKKKEVEILSTFDYEELPSLKGAPSRWILTSDLTFRYKNRNYIIPTGFIWDGSSVPGFLSWYTQRNEHLLASCVHDFTYLTHKIQAEDKDGIIWYNVTKGWSDRVFREIIDDVYCERIGKTFIIWTAVHTIGYFFWYNNTCDFQCRYIKNFCEHQKIGNCPLLKFMDEMKHAKKTLK